MRIHVLYVWIVGVHVCGVWLTRTIPWRDLMFDRERDPTAYVKDAADVSFALQLARVRMMFVALYVALLPEAAQHHEVQDDLFVIIIIEMFKKVISFLIVFGFRPAPTARRRRRAPRGRGTARSCACRRR
jgi:hypothetical protein